MRVLIVLGVAAASWAAQNDPQCELSDSLERFDCFPEDSPSEEKCLARGCCWSDSPAFNGSYRIDFPPLDVPYCYYPKDFRGYRVLNQTSTDFGFSAFLERANPSQIDVDINLLRVDIIWQTSQTVRIRIVDPKQPRWEPPLPAPPAPEKLRFPRYVVKIGTDGRLKVSRSERSPKGITLVDFDLASMVYTDRFIQITSKLPSDLIYGLGEHKGSLRRSTNLTKFTFYNADRAPAYDARLYGTQPLYINLEPDGRANGMWLLNSNAMDIILQPTPAITYRPVGGILDFFVFLGPTPAEVVQQYQQMVGNPKMIPYWALGYHLCRFGYKNTEHTRNILQKNLDAGVRIDVQWNDIDYMNERNDFTLDMENFRDLGNFVDQIHSDGRHYVLIIDPAVSGSEKPGTYPPYDRGIDYDIFVRDINGTIARARVWNRKSSVFPDFTHPNATLYWTEMFSNFHKEVAFDGAWIDMNEPANMINGHIESGCPFDEKLVYTPGDEPLQTKTLCTSDKHHWSEHYNVHNMYGFTEAIATYDALATVRPNKRPLIISRSSFSGLGFYAGHWTGDVFSTWTDLRDSVAGFLEFSFYGIPFVGVDICGFNGNTTADLCARWQALGAFYPFSRNHNTDDGVPQDPASLGDRVLNVTRNAYYWRYKLLPYLYTLFYNAHVDGLTVARPLFFEYPEDPNTHDIDEQFLWGDALMVVPALHENQKTINAYFPEGVWYDLQNRTATVNASTGGKHVSLIAHDDTINFFMRGGRAVFFQEPGETTTDSRQNSFGLYVFLASDNNKDFAVGQVYIDDGESIDAIETKAYNLVSVVANNRGLLLGNDRDQPVKHNLTEVHFFGIKTEPSKVTVKDKPTGDFKYDSSREILSIFNMNMSLLQGWVLIDYP